ncbi:hypothetical protein [Phenylobacterium deserti]|uniref:Uncharacterized protein n=1 Tax=Phenylobacterium deserti TaxID=1914756 RepID=A0A328AU10_9CAUL|nr:hypothetical protein [Phenylobacterium deserti]RAK58059.1 hypothetical protein DJ018_09170 [Phenylobacterium deserti]
MNRRATRYLLAWGLCLATVALIYVAEGALGLNGPPSRLTKRIELAVFAAGLVGILLSRFRAKGLAAAMFATGAAQAGASIAAIAGGLHDGSAGAILDIVGVNLFFGLLFAASGQLFRTAAKPRPEEGGPAAA